MVVVLNFGQNILYIDGRRYEEVSWQSYGGYPYVASALGWQDGIIDNLRIYNRILTQDEVKEIYRAKQ